MTQTTDNTKQARHLIHIFQNSNPKEFDSNCIICGGKLRDSVHGATDEIREATQTKERTQDGYEAGAILESSWGYDQTNIDYFKIIKRTNDTVFLIPLNTAKKETTGFMQGTCRPGQPMQAGEYVSCVGTWNGKPIRRRLARRDGNVTGCSIKHGWAHLYNGGDSHWTAYA